MKKLHLYMLKSFVGPFFATFFISMFVLLMQMLWRYIDDLVGKGLDFSIIMELLFYFSVSLVPMALPLAVLLSSIMTFGNLGENYELIALKSAGISLYRIMRPLIITVILLAVTTFFFSNNIVPYANMKSINLMWDIQKHKPELSFKEGVFTNDLEGYSIKVDKINKETGVMYKMLIYNHKETGGNYEVIRADSGMIVSSANTAKMELVLYSGHTYTDEGLKPAKRKTFPFRRLKFGRQSLMIDLPESDFKRGSEEYVTSKMLNLNQLEYTVDSVQDLLNKKSNSKATDLLSYNYLKSKQSTSTEDSICRSVMAGVVNKTDSLFTSLDPEDKWAAVDVALRYARESQANIKNDQFYMERQQELVRKNQIEWNTKFTFPFACIIFFFIGAPLGSIIRKGGLGAPIVLSVFLFIIYYIVSMIGERSAKEAVLNITFGSWLSSIVFLPIGIILTYQSVTDAEIMNSEAYLKFFNKIASFFKKKRENAKA